MASRPRITSVACGGVSLEVPMQPAQHSCDDANTNKHNLQAGLATSSAARGPLSVVPGLELPGQLFNPGAKARTCSSAAAWWQALVLDLSTQLLCHGSVSSPNRTIEALASRSSSWQTFWVLPLHLGSILDFGTLSSRFDGDLHSHG